jgi:hypothetical protein
MLIYDFSFVPQMALAGSKYNLTTRKSSNKSYAQKTYCPPGLLLLKERVYQAVT